MIAFTGCDKLWQTDQTLVWSFENLATVAMWFETTAAEWALTVWGVSAQSILLYINLSIFGTLPIPVCLHPLNHPVFPLPYGAELNWFQCLWNIVLECVECIITVLPQVLLACALKELNKVEFTVKLGREDAQMPSCFNDFLNTGFLLICNACWLLLGSFRLSTHVLGSRT